jgi:hypothetical protein
MGDSKIMKALSGTLFLITIILTILGDIICGFTNITFNPVFKFIIGVSAIYVLAVLIYMIARRGKKTLQARKKRLKH